MSTQRIAFFTLNYAPETTGIAPYSTGLAEGMAERGAEVQVVTGFPHYPEWKRRNGVAPNELINRVPIRRLEHPVPERPGLKGRMLMEAAFALRCLRVPLARPDLLLVVSPSLLSAAAVVLRGRMSRVPVVVWVQDLYGLGAKETGMLGGLGGVILQKIESLILRGASCVVAIHERFAAKLVEIGVPRERIDVIRNWCHVDTVPTTVTSQEARRRQGWKSDDFVVLHAGNMGVKQGLENVVEAGRLAEGSSVRFVLLGDGNQRRKLEQLAEGLGNVTISDPVTDEEFLPTLQAADALLVNERDTLSDMAVPSKLTSYFAA
ncbi:MAG: glycosyltransferase family 4 protein, partial [Propionibacteriaceae bacterium]|nr:glycosyltransferase family 4 protein [Propionibacteriaceae bacterium]